MTLTPRIGHTQVHLDFHTSKEIHDVSADFDPEEFADTLVAAHVDQVNLFAKCHHSWSYYQTGIGRPHPHLGGRNLLGDQIEACRKRGVMVSIYYTVGWSAGDLEIRPDWAALDPDGSQQARNVSPEADMSDPRPGTSWVYLCPSGVYLDLMERQVREIADRFRPDGFFFDICAGRPCYCRGCLSTMAAADLKPYERADARRFNRRRWETALDTLTKAAIFDGAPRWIFFNGTTVMHETAHHTGVKSGLFRFNTHQELEDLPTTWGGYDRLPLRARFFHSHGYEVAVMSGKFHTAWGEFGGYKSERALEYEARLMIANGARCNFGDQLHPRGRLDSETYRLIGAVYEEVRDLHRFVPGARPDSNLALCLSDSGDDDQGVARALLEAHLEFVVTAPDRLDPSRHQAVVLAGRGAVTDEVALRAYAEQGGRLVVLGDAIGGFSPPLQRDLLGITGAERSRRDGDYTALQDPELPYSGLYYNYEPAWRLDLTGSAEVMAVVHDSYFDRTYGRYCSHQNAPPLKNPSGYPALHGHGRHLVAAHPLGRIYLRYGADIHRSLLWRLIDMANPHPTLAVAGLPPGGRVTVLHQPVRSRTVLHILYAVPTTRGNAIIIDDVVPIRHVNVTLRLGREISAVRDAFTGDRLNFKRSGEAIKFSLPTIRLHRVIVVEHPSADVGSPRIRPGLRGGSGGIKE